MADPRPANFQSCCRLCLCEKLDTLKSVFDETTEDRSLPQKILQFVAIKVTTSDKLTTMVCSQCISKVNNWHAYKQECVNNQNKLERWLISSSINHIANMSLQIKEEPMGDTEDNSREGPENNILEVLVKNEPVEQSDEPMEEEYNELPPPLTPHPLDTAIDSENSQDDGTPGSVNSRQCSICNKLFSSSGNRRKHEKQIHGQHQPGPEVVRRNQMNRISIAKAPDDPLAHQETRDGPSEGQQNSECLLSESERQKIQFAAGLKLLQKNATPISCETLSKIELSYIEKCKAMVNMHRTLECACHNVPHPNLKGLLSHLRALRIWFPVFTCYNCMITFTDRSTFTKHSVRCPKTSLETIMKLSNLRKRSEVKTRLYQNFKCTSCKFMYSFHDDFCKHVDEDHSFGEPPFVCSCGNQFENIEDYKDHAYVSCLVDYYCDICFITTRTLDDFQKHSVEVHDNSEGFILLQDDNYKMRKPFHHNKEVTDESVIVTGKRERRMSIKAPILDTEDEDDAPRKSQINPTILNSHSRECPLCSKEYSTHNNMIRHYKTHLEVNGKSREETEDDSVYACPDCGGMYNTSEWQIHLQEKHELKTCGECGKIFQFQSELDQHRSVHLNLKVYRDSKTQSYKTTMISPGSDEEAMLMCEICDVMFSTKEELNEHKLTHEDDMSTLELLPEEVDDNSQEARYSCKPCNKVYTSYGGIWDHNKKKHPEKKTPFTDEWPKQCKECDKVLQTGAAYFRHKQVHEKERITAEGADVKPTKVPMIKPKREVDDEESYHTCKRCFKVFSSRYNLKNHMKCHGINISPTTKKVVKKYWCDICHQSFPTNELLESHKEEHGPDEVPELANPPTDGLDNKAPFIFTCDVCVMTFITQMALKKHKLTHAREAKPKAQKPSQVYCKYCKIAFESIALLTQHMHVEHDETAKPKVLKVKDKPRQFICNICKKIFLTASALSTHMGWHKRSPSTGDPNKPAKVLKQNKIIDKLANSIKPKQEPIDPPEYQCATCLAELPNDTALQVHILEKHRSVSAIMLIPRCNTCNKDFSNQDEYETHKRLHDFLERQKQQEQQMLLQQQESNENESLPKQQTPSAGKDAIAKSLSLAMQQKYSKSFPCKYCTAAFSRADTLSSHLRQFHKEFIQNEFKCTQCDRVFDKQNSLSIHLKVHEKQRSSVSAPNKPLFSCSICSMGFDLPKDLRAHTISAHPF